jgi:hypothetical protein
MQGNRLTKLTIAAIQATISMANCRFLQKCRDGTAVSPAQFALYCRKQRSVLRDRWIDAPSGTEEPFTRDEHEHLRCWLRELVRHRRNKTLPVNLRTEMAKELATLGGGVRPMILPRRYFCGARSVYTYGIARLVARDSNLFERLGQCERCGKYFFDIRLGRGPHGERYCNPHHRNRYHVYQSNWGKVRPWQRPPLP